MMDKHTDEELDDFLREVDEMTQALDHFIARTTHNVTGLGVTAEGSQPQPEDEESPHPAEDDLLEDLEDLEDDEDPGVNIPPVKQAQRVYPSQRIGRL